MIGGLKTCLLDTKIQDWYQKVLTEHQIVGAAPLEYKRLLLQGSDTEVDLEKENQKVYTELVELGWRTLHATKLKTDMEDAVIEVPSYLNVKEDLCNSDLQDLMAAEATRSKLRFNSRLWLASRAAVARTPLPWEKLWKKKFDECLPIIKLDCSRDQREEIATY
jgi:hypothetical protein